MSLRVEIHLIKISYLSKWDNLQNHRGVNTYGPHCSCERLLEAYEKGNVSFMNGDPCITEYWTQIKSCSFIYALTRQSDKIFSEEEIIVSKKITLK